jgi:hypothetical protein
MCDNLSMQVLHKKVAHWATGLTTRESGFDSRQEQKIQVNVSHTTCLFRHKGEAGV